MSTSGAARAFWVITPGRGAIRDAAIPPCGPDDVRVRTCFSGVSRGTEALVFGGRVPESERTRMRAPFQEGEFPGPVKYGYMNVGIVEQGPSGLAGRAVFVLFPHQTHYIVPASWAHVVPDGVPLRRAVLAANVETAINALWDARPHAGDRIVVVGGGTVGCAVAWAAAGITGCTVQLVDTYTPRADVANALGVSFATPETADGDADIVLHTSGTAEGLDTALRLAGLEGTIVEVSWFGDTVVPLPLGEAFHARRLTLRSSQVGRIPPAQQPRWDTRRRMQLVLDLLRDDRLGVLLTGESRFDDLPTTMARLAAGSPETLCHVVRYD
jgi:NADPH:quinone reductase-like Zn-dependent oxidoreductase